jgi:hypothetical protein
MASTDNPSTDPLLYITALEGHWDHSFNVYAQYELEMFWKGSLI